MPSYPELELSRNEMKLQNELYRPSAFWDDASANIVQELEINGLDKFRSLPNVLAFFVPTYGTPGSGFSVEHAKGLLEWFKGTFPEAAKAQMALDQFINGKMSAQADYRSLIASDDKAALPYLHTFSESNIGEPIEQFEFEGRVFSRSSLNYLLGLAMLKKHLKGEVPKVVLEIGGGFGTLGEVLFSAGIEGLRYINIDIPPTSFVSQYYLSELLGRDRVATFEKTKNKTTIEINDLPEASVLCSWQIEKLKGNVDLFVNFISFQEMEPTIVKNYLAHVIALNTRWILLRNMREGKKQNKQIGLGVSVDTPILGEDYLHMLPDYEVVETNVFPYGFRTVDGFHSELILLKRKQ
jgi:putative sugar O-methyltransferase